MSITKDNFNSYLTIDKEKEKDNKDSRNNTMYFKNSKESISPILKESIEEIIKNNRQKVDKRTFGYYINVELDKKLGELANKLRIGKSDFLETLLKNFFKNNDF